MNLITQIMFLVGTFSLICSAVLMYPEECSTLNTLAHLARRGLECNNYGTDCICEALGVIEDADDYTNGMENINILEGNLTYVSELELVCQTYSSIQIQWNFTYPENIPVVYLIEINSEFYKEWMPLMTARKNIAVLRDLASNTSYRVRVRAITAKGQIGKPVISRKFTLLPGYSVANTKNLASNRSYRVHFWAITAKGQIGKPVISREFKTLPDTTSEIIIVTIVSTILIISILYILYELCKKNEILRERRQPCNMSTVIGQNSRELELGVVHTRSVQNEYILQ